MASECIDEITARYSALQSLYVSNLEDNLEWNICHAQTMWVQIATEMSKLQEKPMQQANQTDQVDNLQMKDQELAETIEEEMTHQEQVSVLSWMHLQQVEEVKAQSQEIWCWLPLVENNGKPLNNWLVPRVLLGNREQHHLTPKPSWMQWGRKYSI